MSCYFRHMKDVFDELGIEILPENKKDIDAIIHRIVGVEYKNCSPTWKQVKEEIKTDPERRARFIEQLKKELS